MLLTTLSALLGSLSATTSAPPPTPSGGQGLNVTPAYIPMSDFDFQSLNLALNQEFLEFELFHRGLAQFTPAEFEAVGINVEDQFFIEYMADQENGHAIMLSNILQGAGAKSCTYNLTFTNVASFGEAGVFGFLEHLDSRAASQLLLQSIATEGRQQMGFRQLLGLFPMPTFFMPAFTQSMQWTLMAPFISACPASNPRIAFQNFPALTILNNPDAETLNNSTVVGENNLAALSHNRTTPLSFPGRQVDFSWELPGRIVGPNNSFTTTTTAGQPRFALWISQLNITYTPLENLNGTTATTIQPDTTVFGDGTASTFNGTMFIAITDLDLFVTPFNFSSVNPHIVAGPAVYQAG
ncbi:Rds1 protein [Amanita muscaria]